MRNEARLGQLPERLIVPGPRPCDQVGCHFTYGHRPGDERGGWRAPLPPRRGVCIGGSSQHSQRENRHGKDRDQYERLEPWAKVSLDEVSKLKQEIAGDIVVCASYQLGRTLLEHDLVDELRLVIYPVVLGAGTKTTGDGLALLIYQPVRDATAVAGQPD